jgi:hypothetical protein
MPRKPRFPEFPRITKHYRDRHGKPRFYVDGVGLKSRFGTPEFRAEYDRAILSLDEPAPKLGAIHGSLRWGCKQFMDATFTSDPKTATQHERRLRLESMCVDVWKAGDTRTFGDFPLNRFEPKHILALMLRKKKNPHAANKRFSDLKMVFKWLKQKKLIPNDPTAEMDQQDKLPVPKTDGYHSWPDEERQQYCATHPPETMARDAYELLWIFGQRNSDTVKFGKHNVKDGHLCFTQQKTGKFLQLWIPPEAQSIIARDGVFLRTAKGKAFTRDTFKERFRAWCDEARLPTARRMDYAKLRPVIMPAYPA